LPFTWNFVYAFTENIEKDQEYIGNENIFFFFLN